MRQFWGEILASDWDPESNWYGWQLVQADHVIVKSDRETLSRELLHALGVRRHEPDFLEQLVALHRVQLRARQFDPHAFLALEPRLVRIDPILTVLREALSLNAPLHHLGKLRHELARPAGANFTVATHSGSYPNGAGTVTHSETWRLDLYAPTRLRLELQVSDEEGTEPSWSRTLEARAGQDLQPLIDAFLERGLHVSPRTNPHLD